MFVIAGIFGLAAYCSYAKEWRFGFYFSLIVCAAFIGIALPNTRAFMRTTAWAAFVTALESTGQGLARLNSAVDDIRTGVTKDQGELDGVQKQTREMQESLRSAQQALQKQQEKLADLDQLITSIYEARKSEVFDTRTDSSQLIALAHDNSHVTVYACLASPPIPQTLDLQWYLSVQPKDSYMTASNVVIFRWGQSVDSFRTHTLTFTYVPKPKEKSVGSKLMLRGNRVFVDDKPLIYGFPNLDPVFNRLVEQANGDAAKVTMKAWETAVEAEQKH